MSGKLVQRSGANSTSIQAETVNIGPSYRDIRQIALDVFEQNYLKLSGEAVEIALTRARALLEEFLRRLQATTPESLENVRMPDMLRAIYRAQEGAATAGEPDLSDLLVELLVARAGQPGRTLEQLVLDEAIVTAQKLTSGQIATLSALFYLTRVGHNSLDEEGATLLCTRYLGSLGPIASSPADIGHLEYAGCVSISEFQTSITSVMQQKHPLLFKRGLTEDRIADEYRAAFVTDSTTGLLVLPGRNEAELVAHLRAVGLHEKLDQVKNINSQSNCSAEEIIERMSRGNALVAAILKAFDDSDMKSASLTPIGVAIGHGNFRRTAGLESPLSTWLG